MKLLFLVVSCFAAINLTFVETNGIYPSYKGYPPLARRYGYNSQRYGVETGQNPSSRTPVNDCFGYKQPTEQPPRPTTEEPKVNPSSTESSRLRKKLSSLLNTLLPLLVDELRKISQTTGVPSEQDFECATVLKAFRELPEDYCYGPSKEYFPEPRKEVSSLLNTLVSLLVKDLKDISQSAEGSTKKGCDGLHNTKTSPRPTALSSTTDKSLTADSTTSFNKQQLETSTTPPVCLALPSLTPSTVNTASQQTTPLPLTTGKSLSTDSFCATNGSHYFFFENESRFNEYNNQLFPEDNPAWRPETCKRPCKQMECSLQRKQDHICAAQPGTKRRETMRSECELGRTVCLIRDTLKIRRREKCINPCSKKCEALKKRFDPLCAQFGDQKVSYVNKCWMDCQLFGTQKRWAKIYKGNCSENSTIPVDDW